ncbi:Odorant receptor 44 [Halyomorpha halys]|nr:Odorant receptor 44 [Halyomorpha halys]
MERLYITKFIILRGHQFATRSRSVMIDEGIEDSDILEGLNVRYLKIFGLWKVINDYRKTGNRNGIIKFEVFCTFILTLPYVICQYMSYFNIEVDIQKATFLNLYPLPALQMCCRIAVFWFRIDIQCRLYDLIKKNFLNIPEGSRAQIEEIYKRISKVSNMCCMATLIVNATIVSLYVVNPGISVDYILYHTGSMTEVTTGRKKILGGWYPVPMAESPYYEIIFVYEAICILWGGLFLAVYFSLYYHVLVCLYAHFTVLGFQIENLKMKSVKNGGSKSCIKRDQNNNSIVYENLIDIIRDHQKLLRYFEELRTVYNPLVTLTLGIGVIVLIIGAIQFLLGKSINPGFIFQISEVFALQGLEVCMFCFGSSSIEAASSGLQFAIYSSDWYKANVKFRKAAQMLMVRANRGVSLTAIRMYPVNVETLMAILQFTYSTATLMMRMTE